MQYELNENICVFKIMCIQKARLLIYILKYRLQLPLSPLGSDR